MKRINIKGLLLCLPIFLLAQVSTATELKTPQENILLTVSGHISIHNTANNRAQFDLPMLQKFETHTIKTETPWTDGLITFEGVRIKDLLTFLKADGSILKATALNDYSVNIPIGDIYDYDVILAYRKSGKLMSVRDKGPLWIIYPWSDKPQLKTELFHSRSIWQLIKLTVE